MSDGYTKLFSDIVDSSIWDEDAQTRVVWVTLLALSNPEGYVRGSVGWLAGKSKVPIQCTSLALQKFAAPDPHSRTPDHEGRRIEVLEDGWLILNYLLFRDRLSTNPTSIKTRERVRRHRERYIALRNARSVTAHHSDSDSDSVPLLYNSSLTSTKLTTKGKKALDAKLRPTAERFEKSLGAQWVNDAGKWVNRIKAHHSKCERVVAELESAIRESRIKTSPAQYAEQIWKEFQ